jgi:hypothetical protein
MAKGRIRSRLELREQYEAAEAREQDKRKSAGEDDEDEHEDEEPGEEGEVEDEGEEGDEEAPPRPKKKKPAKEPKPRKKAAKQVRRRVVWVVLDNSNKPIARYDYTKKQEADEHAARLASEKKQIFFVQPLKEEITE